MEGADKDGEHGGGGQCEHAGRNCGAASGAGPPSTERIADTRAGGACPQHTDSAQPRTLRALLANMFCRLHAEGGQVLSAPLTRVRRRGHKHCYLCPHWSQPRRCMSSDSRLSSCRQSRKPDRAEPLSSATCEAMQSNDTPRQNFRPDQLASVRMHVLECMHSQDAAFEHGNWVSSQVAQKQRNARYRRRRT